MKKFFILISATLIALAVNATVININTETSDALRVALNSAADGDEIVMADGTYVESPSNYIAFAAKSVVVRAADGANVIVKPHVPITLSGGARAEIKGIKIDASELCSVNSYSHLMYPSDGADNNRLILDGCEIYGYTEGKAVIASRSSNKLDSLIINNCKFYNHTTRSCVFLENTANLGLIVTNSTFYNIATGTEDFGAGVIDDRSTTAKVRIDHCTFYNVVAQNTDYAAIGKIKTSDAIVSNCIFAMPTSTADLRAIRDVATANNCLTYNYTKDDNWGIHGDVAKNNCIQLLDPLFANAAGGDFSLAGNWTTMSISPAREAGTDGSDLGDPRWYSAETLPSTSFASAYYLLGTKALLVGNIRLNASNHIEYYNKSENGTAKWKLHIGRTCRISAVADREAESTSGCTLTLTVKDADGNVVSSISAARSDNDNDIIFPGTLNIPEEGDYTIILTNAVSWSSAILEKITLTYEGGAVQNIATDANSTLNVADAWYSGCTRDNEKTYIQYPSSSTSDAWIKWNIATSETKYYDLTVNVNTEYNHGFTAAIYEDEEAAPVASVTEGSFVETKGVLALELGRVNLVGGKNYVVKVTNAPSGSQAKVTSVVFAPVVATATDLPDELDFSNAVLSEKAFIQDGMLYFNEIGDSNPVGQWAQWEVTTDHNGLFLFTMGVTSTNEQTYKITIKDDGDNELDYYETSPGSGDKTLTHYFALSAGNYFVKVENTRSWSHGHLTSFAVTEPSGIVTIDEAATNTDSWASKVDENTYDVQTLRTIKAGMYNTICLPFDVSSSQCREIFGSDVQLRTLGSADIEENVLNLNFDVTSDISHGTPQLIKTSRDIVNPVFVGVKLVTTTPGVTNRENANFIGNFVAGTIEADPDNLYLGANNKLFFPTVDIPISGMRAYFRVHDVPSGVIQRARIVLADQTATDIELVDGEWKEVDSTRKFIENGQLVIIRDGIRYNVMGARVK